MENNQEWIKFNERQEKWEDDNNLEYSYSRQCELCGTIGFTTKKIVGLKRKIILQGYSLGGIKSSWRYQCQNRIKCNQETHYA